AVDVGPGHVGQVVAVLLQELDHRQLRVPQPALAHVVAARVERPVVGHLVGGLVGGGIAGRAGNRALVEAVAPVGAGGLPGLVGGLHDHVGVAGVVADHERDVAAATVVVADQVGDVDTRDRVGWHRPGRGHPPVAAV